MKKFIKLAGIIIYLLLINVNVDAQLKLSSTGNITLGSTTAPPSGFKLQVIGNSVFSASTSSITSSAYIRGLNGYSTSTTPDYTWYGNDQVGIFHPASNIIGFCTYGTERMRINSSGNIQINTSSIDNANLTIYNNQTGNQRGIYLDIHQNADWVQTMTTKCYRAYSVNYCVNLDGNGDKFYVQGDGLVCTARGMYVFSDMSLKENIENIPNALNKVLQLHGVYYNYIADAPSGGLNGPIATPTKQLGLIAQEVEQIVPEVVMTTKDGLKAVAYQNLVGLLIEAFKEQNNKISYLEQDLNNCCIINKSKSSGNELNDDKSLEQVSPKFTDDNKTAKLYQNKPNPFNNQTVIEYYIPSNSSSASIIIFDMQGKLLRTMPIKQKESGNIVIDAGSLYAGMYMYSLLIDGKEIDTKRMIITE